MGYSLQDVPYVYRYAPRVSKARVAEELEKDIQIKLFAQLDTER